LRRTDVWITCILVVTFVRMGWKRERKNARSFVAAYAGVSMEK
jgi:hypothetical protein